MITDNSQTVIPQEPLQTTECHTILESLRKHDWNKNEVAEELRIHDQHFGEK